MCFNTEIISFLKISQKVNAYIIHKATDSHIIFNVYKTGTLYLNMLRMICVMCSIYYKLIYYVNY